jgi:hypothetical protein
MKIKTAKWLSVGIFFLGLAISIFNILPNDVFSSELSVAHHKVVVNPGSCEEYYPCFISPTECCVGYASDCTYVSAR